MPGVTLHTFHGPRQVSPGVWSFRAWAPKLDSLTLVVHGDRERRAEMLPCGGGYVEAVLENVAPGTHYHFLLNGKTQRPDPASRFQPDGVHAPSCLVDPAFPWTDAGWRGVALEDYVLYELHTGAFTASGSFDAVIPRLGALRDLGVTAVEIMPVAQFPGARNWGYDGVFPFAAQNSYGGPDGFRRLVDACHREGLAVVLDVVYNHLGPEGNYLNEFGPYFSGLHRTPWGPALNFDGRGSDEVRRYFVENACYWLGEMHVDALRLDAISAIFDQTPAPFLEELSSTVQGLAQATGRRLYLMAESIANDPRTVRPLAQGGYGMDAEWSDDFHNSIHALLTGDQAGYYIDYGAAEQVARAFRDGYVFTGQHSKYRGRRYGRAFERTPFGSLVVYSHNHDQVGNRGHGERLPAQAGMEAQKLASAAVLLSPFLPLFFMGEEYGETAPFLFFVSFADEALVRAVREGRRREFGNLLGRTDPPDPQAEETFLRSRLNWALRGKGAHAGLLAYHQGLLRLRREMRREPLVSVESGVEDGTGLVWVHMVRGTTNWLLCLNFDREERQAPGAAGARWKRVFDSARMLDDSTALAPLSAALWRGPDTAAG